MTANTKIATRVQAAQPHKSASYDLRTSGFLAKWPIIGIVMFLLGGLMFSGLAYNLFAQGPLLARDKTLATTLPAIGLRNVATLQPLMDAGYYLGSWGLTALGFILGLYFLIKRYWQELAMLAIGMAGEALLFYSISMFFDRVWPPTQIWVILHIPGFPSGHAVASVVFFGFLAYLLAPKMQFALGKGSVVAVALFIIFFIGFTRVFYRRSLFDRCAGWLRSGACLVRCGLYVDRDLLQKKKDSKCQKRINQCALS